MDVLESSRVSDASVSSCNDAFGLNVTSVQEGDNLGENLLEDFDSYMEDINDRLIISRMVSDSLIKGMVTAVEQEATNKINGMELEVAELREKLGCYPMDDDETELAASQFSCSESVKWLEMINEVSNIRQDVTTISKSLSMSETVNTISKSLSMPETELASHKSFESLDEKSNSKRTDHMLPRVLSSQVSASSLLSEFNGEQESKSVMPLSHMTKSQLIDHFHSVTTKMKRDHESNVHKITEELFSLKREYLKEKGPSLSLRNDKEFEVLKRKMSEVAVKLDDVIVKNEKLYASSNHANDMVSLKSRFKALLFENHKLKNFIANRKDEAKCLVSQDADMECVIMEGLFRVIFWEVLKDIEEKVGKLCAENMKEYNFLQMKLADNDKLLAFEIEENERLKQELCILKEEIREKEQLTIDLAADLAKEKERFELTNEEISGLRDLRNQQESLVSRSNAQLEGVKCALAEALEQIDCYKVEAGKLNQKVEKAMKELIETREERNTLLTFKESVQNNRSEAQQRECPKQTESITLFVHGLTKIVEEFECRVAEDIKNKRTRVETLNFQFQKLKMVGLRYKHKLDKGSNDLRLAEAEVDLLGDQVDALLSVLEKVYIGLDHYSPILQHYPGIMEILKLVRRELSGECLKLN